MRKYQYQGDQDINDIIERIDTANNGAINFNEFIAATLNTNITQDYKWIKEAFKFFDLNHDEFIDENDLKFSLSGKEFENIDINVFKDMIKEWDYDNDGKISLDDFLQIMGLTIENSKLDIIKS